MNLTRVCTAAALVSITTLIVTHPANAQNTASLARAWSPWFGCWHAQGAPASEKLCIVPDGDGARMVTVVDGTTREESRVIADGRERDVVQDECRGNERARWSSDRRRIFLNAELRCGDTRRFSSGLMAFTDPSHWVSVQAVTVDGQTATRSTEYEVASTRDVARSVTNLFPFDVSSPDAARIAAAADVSDDDVDEAADMIDDAAVQEWLRSSGADYDVMPGSALSQLNRDYGSSTVVVERPVYVERTHVVRCWDPFWGGFVVGVSRHVSVGVNVGSGCGRYYYTRYSPWGYDLYGWHTYRPVIFVNRYQRYNTRPIIIRGGSTHYRNDGHRNDGYRDDHYRNDHGRDDHGRDDHYRNDGGRNSPRDHETTDSGNRDRDRSAVTREGYTTRGSGSPSGGTREPRNTVTVTRGVDRSQSTPRASESSSSQRTSENRAAHPRTARSRD